MAKSRREALGNCKPQLAAGRIDRPGPKGTSMGHPGAWWPTFIFLIQELPIEKAGAIGIERFTLSRDSRTIPDNDCSHVGQDSDGCPEGRRNGVEEYRASIRASVALLLMHSSTTR